MNTKINTYTENLAKPLLANRLFKFRFWGNFGELNEEEDICEMEMLYGDKFCFFESEPINDLFSCRNFQVMQFTGLKDKKGAEIYEGDIVYIKNNGLLIVCFYKGEFKLQTLNEYNKKRDFYSGICHLEFSSLKGNIYENPELLQTSS